MFVHKYMQYTFWLLKMELGTINMIKSRRMLFFFKSQRFSGIYSNKICYCWQKLAYRKVESSRLSRLVACLRIFRLLMKGEFDDYVLWPLAKRVKNRIVDQSTARDFTVFQESRTTFMERKQIQVVQYNCMDSTAYRNCAELWSVCTQSLSCILLFPRKSCLSARIG